MTFGLNFQNMFNMNTMMNLGSMVGMGGFGLGGYSTGINPFGSVFSFYGSGSGCCSANYSTRSCANSGNAWSNGLGAMLGYAGVMLGTPLLIKGGAKLFDNIKANSKSTLQANAEAELKDTNSKLEAEYKKLGIPVGSEYKTEEDQVYIDKEKISGELAKLQGDFDKQNEDLSDIKSNYSKAETELTAAKQAAVNAKTALDAAPVDDPNRPALQAEYDKAVKAQNNAQEKADETKAARDAAQKLVNETEAKIETKKGELAEAEKAVTAREKEVKEILAEIKTLEAQQAEEQVSVDQYVLDDLDGTRLGRTTADNFKKVYNLEKNEYGKNNKGKTYSAGDITNADMKYLLSEYATLDDGEKKQKIGQYIKDNWDNFDQKVRDKFKPALEIIKRDLPDPKEK